MFHAVATSHSALSTSALCRTRTDLLDRLAYVVAELGRAKLQLANGSAGDAMRMDVERLRHDYGDIRDELERLRISMSAD
jgi:hypothetical protein